MDQKAILETVFKAVVKTLPTELGALLGQELKCSAAKCKLITKEQFFSNSSRQKSSLAHLKVLGDHEGEAFLILPTTTSIIFGGTLIMLPQSLIDENVANETLDGEVADAYAEVANILAGVLTQVFLDKYSKSLRYVRTLVEELSISNIDIASDKPFPPGTYFHVCSDLSMGGTPLGQFELITPAALLELDEIAAEETLTSADPAAKETVPGAAAKKPSVAGPVEKNMAPPAAPKRTPFADAKKLADVVLKATIGQVAEEVGALLGQPLVCSDLKLEMISKEDFFNIHCLENSILTHMEVSGSSSGKIYLLNQVKDAILTGGTLIMLPEEEILSQMGKGQFDGEVADAYGEIANIIAGGLTHTFQDRYPQPLRFVKKTSENIVPTKIIPATEKPFPDGLYYLASCAITLQGKPLDRLHLLFPAELLGLDAQSVETASSSTGLGQAGAQVASGSKASSAQSRQAPPPPAGAMPVILVIADTPADAEAIRNNLEHDTYEIKVIGYKDDVRSVFSAHPVLGVFLLMTEVGEKGFSVAIKLQSCGYTLPPMIAGGPEWTRSAVLKAIKYGARDILVTPASNEEIRTKASAHLMIPA